jgi:hypothetical protein
MRRKTRATTAAMIAVMGVTMISGMAEAAPRPPALRLERPTPTTCGQWTIDATPHIRGGTQLLSGVAAVAPDDVWAVGWGEAAGLGVFGLAEHWDGTAWSRVSVPPGDPGTWVLLSDVAALATDDVWAVGSTHDTSTGASAALAMHWDGSAWSIDPTSPTWGNLSGVAVIPGTDSVWAVGERGIGSSRSLIARRSPQGWKAFRAPSPGSVRNELTQVSASGDGDAWATGGSTDASGVHALTLRWDGASWTVAPDPGAGGIVAAIGPNDALSAGDDFDRWDGATWSDLGPTGGFPYGITSTPTDGWTAGFQGPQDFYSTYTAHWDGSAWSVVASPNVPGQQASLLYDVTALPGSSSAWAVGTSYYRNDHLRAIETVLIESSC